MTAEAPVFYFINLGHSGDMIFSRPFIKEVIDTYPDVAVILVCVDKFAYLLEDLGAEVVTVEDYEHSTLYTRLSGEMAYTDVCFFNMITLSGANEPIYKDFGISYQNLVHTYNYHLKQEGMYERYRIRDRRETPFFEFPKQPHVRAAKPRAVLVENGPVFSRQSFLEINEYMREFSDLFPLLNFYCAAKPNFSAANVFDVSDLNLIEISELGNGCVAFLTRCSGVNAASLTERNKYKPRCFAGINAFCRSMWKWELEENPVVYADDKEMIIEFLAMVDKYADVLPVQTRDMAAHPGKYKAKLRDYAPVLSFGKFIKAEKEAKNCTEYLKAALLRPNADENKNPGLALVLSDLSDGNILDIGCSGSGLLINALYKGIPGEKYGIDFEGPKDESPVINRLTGDIRDEIDLPDGYFQNITCLSALKYRADTERFAAEVSRLLAPGGKLYLGFESGADIIPKISEAFESNALVLTDDVNIPEGCFAGVLRFEKGVGCNKQ